MEAQASSTMLGETGKRVAASVSDHWKPPPPSPSRVKVYDEDKLAMLLGDAPPPTHQSVTLGRTRSIHAAMRAQQRSEKRRQAREAEEQRVRRYERHRDEANKRQAEAERAVREQLIESAARRERKFNELRSDIVEGHKLADEIQQHLSLQEMNARTKLKRQFDEWNDGVYGAIQDQINDRLDGMDSSEINRRRRHEFQKFLDTTNAKGAIFRDIIIESRARVAVRNGGGSARGGGSDVGGGSGVGAWRRTWREMTSGEPRGRGSRTRRETASGAPRGRRRSKRSE